MPLNLDNPRSTKAASSPSSQDLPEPLRRLVRQAVEVLGEVIRKELGLRRYRRIEALRREMAELRDGTPELAGKTLTRALAKLGKLSTQERHEIAHSYTLMLELMNACESAYRTHKLHSALKERRSPLMSSQFDPVIYVLTAHPTEARSPENIAIFHELQKIMVSILREDQAYGFKLHEPKLRHALELAWRTSVVRRRKPTVRDEADHIYSIVLRKENIEALLEANAEICPVVLRSWVGGDKDGHPYVDERTLATSLGLSRVKLVGYARGKLSQARASALLVGERALAEALRELEKKLVSLRNLDSRDGAEIKVFHRKLRDILVRYDAAIGALSPELIAIQRLFDIFPALVVPLELRESSELIEASARGEDTAIVRMLGALATLARGGDPRWYARGLIVSMASSAEHIEAAASIVRQSLGELFLPVIPLFEQSAALADAGKTVESVFANRELSRALKNKWGNCFEVMLGYSDSAKEVGVLASRVAISDAMHSVDQVCRRHGARALFFHGSGGSVDRGGGSIREQTAWWPVTALQHYKATIQGEMVERAFASPEIFKGTLDKLIAQTKQAQTVAADSRPSKAVRHFCRRVSALYEEWVKSPDFLHVIEQGTPYKYLKILRLGSRPAKRARALSVQSLRAIPWVLCWTQTRVLFPTWWGVGTAWNQASELERAALKRAFEKEPLFSSYIKLLGFTLAKVELPVWRLYLWHGLSDRQLAEQTFSRFERELSAAKDMVRSLSSSPNLLWFRPWLGESVRLRSPMIHPLNLLQILALKERDTALIRETVTGIASGMMTTG